MSRCPRPRPGDWIREHLGVEVLAARDGPFAEAKEMIGGFLPLGCETRDQAVRLARECPAAE